MQRFGGGLVFKAHRLCLSLNSRLEGNKEERKTDSDEADGPHESTYANITNGIVNARGNFQLFGHVTLRSAHGYVTKR